MLLSPGEPPLACRRPCRYALSDGQASRRFGRRALLWSRLCVSQEARGRLKLLFCDGLGLLYRRLDQGRFHWPRAESGAVELSCAQWALLMEGRPWSALPLRSVLQDRLA
ncbi:MAG: IS66 family insertion sequence element accessory protein TnpB [Acidiferrobacter sp.]